LLNHNKCAKVRSKNINYLESVPSLWIFV